MKPSIGRIVHYQSYGTPGGEYPPETFAAMIVKVISDEEVILEVHYENGLSFKPGIRFSEEPQPGHWNWPPRV